MMRNINKHDIKGSLVVVTVGFSLLTMAGFAIRQIFRVFTFRKGPTVDYPTFHNYRRASKLGATAVAPALDPIDITDYTPAIDDSEINPRLTMFASEDVLRRDWDSPEEDEAWAHL